jgi:hypothetical protein
MAMMNVMFWIYQLCSYKDFDAGGISELIDGELIQPVVLYDFLYDYLLLYNAEKVYKFGNLTFAVDATYSSSYFSYGGNVLYEETREYEFCFCFIFLIIFLGVVNLLALQGKLEFFYFIFMDQQKKRKEIEEKMKKQKRRKKK